MSLLDPDGIKRDGLMFKRELDNQSSALSYFRNGLYLLREQNIEKAKRAHARMNEERASYYMGVVEGLDQAIKYPQAVIEKCDSLLNDEAFAPKERTYA